MVPPASPSNYAILRTYLLRTYLRTYSIILRTYVRRILRTHGLHAAYHVRTIIHTHYALRTQTLRADCASWGVGTPKLTIDAISGPAAVTPASPIF